jgi:hypothetical protein
VIALSAGITHADVAEMTNFYLSAFPKDPIIRAAVMQSSDSERLYCSKNVEFEQTGLP